jgi:adenylate cyclase, class 2
VRTADPLFGTVPGVCEVEVKYRVDDPVELCAALERQGIALSAPVHQEDQVYAPANWERGQSRLGVPFVRLRTQGNRHVFTVKTPVDNEQACLEQETEVVDREQMHRALLAMGFRPLVRVVKNRRTGHLGALSLCVDEVEGAGHFLEVERIVAPNRSGELTQRELVRFVALLGLHLKRTNGSYDSLVYAAQHGLIGRIPPDDGESQS